MTGEKFDLDVFKKELEKAREIQQGLVKDEKDE